MDVYQNMSISEKIDFLYQVHREEISLWDDDGNDNELWTVYHNIQNELLERPEMLSCEDILHVMRIFDDHCFELSWQYNLSKIIAGNCLYYGKSRIIFYLQHLQEVPAGGRFHGWYVPIKIFSNKPAFQEVLQEQPIEIQTIVQKVLDYGKN